MAPKKPTVTKHKEEEGDEDTEARWAHRRYQRQRHPN